MNALNAYQQRAEAALEHAVPNDCGQLSEAMRYATLGGGKRLRAALVYACAADFSVSDSDSDPAAAAVEFIHAYSLAHDDLPAMDDDDLRRGKPSLHKAFDEATAILAGDALNTLAFTLLTHAPLPSAIALRQIRRLGEASGGMIYGQMLDMAHTGQKPDLAAIQHIHTHKTGDLLNACLHLGALPSPDYDAHKQALEAIGKAIGIAYQIADDVLDATVDSAQLGKTAGKDSAQGKNTYPALLGLEASRDEAAKQFDLALERCKQLPNQGAHLAALIALIAKRDH
ncbi:polyprenyl synthetase family protein [Suttonella sp. R2A3]|uniref:polyprenyl synthetase family protein n=1 Tax=Suttonella sp. R2A3 TaxID=2908648 RepID=UPI001F2306C9|nr:farnesyl diphosphate synthase [Suttonella sp. R2A3]UJF23723.1 polyprenyl synthetase family protein [Suttonella sp. R2A3]